MFRERIVWIVALLIVAGLGFYSGQTIGVRAGEQNRATAAQGFLASAAATDRRAANLAARVVGRRAADSEAVGRLAQ